MTYDYKCTCCQAKFELKRSMSEEVATAKCPKCGGNALRYHTQCNFTADALALDIHGQDGFKKVRGQF